MNRIQKTLLLLLVVVSILGSGEVRAADLSFAIEQVLSGTIPPEIKQYRDFELLMGELTEFYDARDYESAWIVDGELSAQARKVLVELESGSLQGLRVGDYIGGSISKGPKATDGGEKTAEQLARIDVATTGSLMRYIKDLHEGRFSPRFLKLGLEIEHRELELASEIRRLYMGNDPVAQLESYAPQHEGYRQLRNQLAYYRSLADTDPWQALDDSKTLKEGDSYADAPQLGRRLHLTGDLEMDPDEVGSLYDTELATAVMRFQLRHGLNDDGIVGKDTFAQLNMSWSDRVVQIAASLERWRWVPDDIETNVIVVNVPGFQLGAYNDVKKPNQRSVSSRVIVGKS